MSLYVTWVNLIKEKADETWLTDSQRRVYEQILERWQSHPFINLYGPSGSGKTFLARLLARHRGYAYTQDLASAPAGASQVVVDNAEYSRMMRSDARMLGIGRVLLITRNPVREAMPKVELTLTTRDVNQFCAVLSERCSIALIYTTPEEEDLGEILRKEVIARGETNVHQQSGTDSQKRSHHFNVASGQSEDESGPSGAGLPGTRQDPPFFG